MATARCYTKSGSVEKYESGCFSGAGDHYPISFSHNITDCHHHIIFLTGPDSILNGIKIPQVLFCLL